MECRSFQELEESTKPLKIGCGLKFIASWMPTAKVCYCPECKMEILMKHQYGMTLKPSQQEIQNSPKVLISSSAGSRNYARTSALQDLEKAWKESEADYFSRSFAWPKKSSPDSYSWKTFRQLPPLGDCELLKKLPLWGMIVDGVLFPLLPLERYTIAKGGFYWPTPTASQMGKPIRKPSPSRKNKKHGYDLQDRIGERHPELIGKKINAHFLEWMMGYQMNWTELKHWAMQWYLNKQKKHLSS